VVWTATRIAHWQTTGVRHPLYPLFHLVALHGLRRGEVAALRWCDLDLDAGTLTVCRQVRRAAGHLQLVPPKSEASNRIIALDHATRAMLRQRHATAEQTGTAVGYVFGADGRPCDPDRLTRQFRALAEATGLPPIRLHDLRHGAASLSLAAGNDLKVSRPCSATPASCSPPIPTPVSCPPSPTSRPKPPPVWCSRPPATPAAGSAIRDAEPGQRRSSGYGPATTAPRVPGSMVTDHRRTRTRPSTGTIKPATDRSTPADVTAGQSTK
jgi:hypothetical protein